MKNLFVIVLAAIGMVSCMNTDEVIEVNSDNAIAFNDAFVENSVRAMIDNDSFNQFNVWGWMEEGTVEAPVFNAKEVTNSGAGWTYSPAQYWVPGFTYTFKALSSNGGNGWSTPETTDGHLGTVTFINNDGTEDLVYATAIEAAPALGDTKTVALNFAHQLAKVKFTFEYAPELVEALELSGLTIKAEEITMNVPAQASIDYSADVPAWILDPTAGQTTLAFAESGVERLTIPAGATYKYDITFKVNYYQGANVIKSLDKESSVSLAVEMGNSYNFIANLTPENLGLSTIDFVTKVEGWEDGSAAIEPSKSIAYVSNNDELVNAFTKQVDKIILLNDIALTQSATRAEADATLTINGNLTIDLNDKTLSGVSTLKTNPREMFLVKGNLTVQNGTIEYKHEGENMGWNGMSTIFDITAGGVVTLNGVTAKNLGGTDMNFVAHLNNWGEATLNVENSTLESTYIAVRAFNSGNDMNNITINNSTLKGKYCFWVHNHVEAGDSVGTDATLNLDILNATNTFEYTGKAPILYGFNEPVYYNVVTTADEFANAIASDVVGVAVAADIEVAPVKIANGKTVIIDLGGNTLSAVDTTEEGYEMISNAGNLTIKGKGKMTVEATINSGWSRRSSVISNTVGGNLTIEGGVIEHLGGTDMAYGIDNLTNGKGTYAVTVVKGGLVKSTYSAIRQFLNGTEATNELYVKAGAELYSPNRAVFFQDPSANANTGKLVIEEGAKVTGKVYLSSTSGSTEWPVEVSVAASALTEGSVVAHSEVLPAGYSVVEENGIWTVVESQKWDGTVDTSWYDDQTTEFTLSSPAQLAGLAQLVVGGKSFEGQTITLDANVDLDGQDFTPIGYNPKDGTSVEFKGTFDGNGKTIKNLQRTDLTYANKRAIGLFSKVNNATVKNLTLEDFSAATYGGEAAAIACVGTGDCTFENLTFKKGSVVAYNNDTSAVLGWANGGNFTFKNITVGSDVTIFSLWDSYDTCLGGVVGTLESGSTVTFEDINVACKLDAYNDVCANYQWGAYRRTGMLIGNMSETQTINGTTYPNPEAAGVTCKNVTVTYGDWMFYHYCEFESKGKPSYADEGEWKYGRVEASDWGSDGIDITKCEHDTDESHNECFVVDQLFGGGQGVYGLAEYPGVTVIYPANYQK